jgi:HEAT repeat protein
MTTQQNTVRTGDRRPALRGSVALILATGALLVCTGSQALKHNFSLSQQNPVQAQDTAQLTALLARVRGSDATVCQLIGRALDNRWGNWGGHIVDPTAAGADQALLDWINTVTIDETMLPTLRRGLSDPDGCVRRTSAHLLGRARFSSLSADLRSELGSPSAATREAALLAIGYADQATGLAAAQRAMRDADASVRVAAAWALGMIENADAMAALNEAARDPDVRMRRTVAWALGMIENPASVPVLSGMLTDPESSVRIQAAFALGQIESKDAVPALVRLLETDRDPQVRRAAAAALGQISG